MRILQNYKRCKEEHQAGFKKHCLIKSKPNYLTDTNNLLETVSAPTPGPDYSYQTLNREYKLDDV